METRYVLLVGRVYDDLDYHHIIPTIWAGDKKSLLAAIEADYFALPANPWGRRDVHPHKFGISDQVLVRFGLKAGDVEDWKPDPNNRHGYLYHFTTNNLLVLTVDEWFQEAIGVT